MGYCEYVNHEKSNITSGWYCNRIGGFVGDSSITRNYCNDSIHCVECPHRGGSKKKTPPPEPKYEPPKQSCYDDDDFYCPPSSSSGSGGSSSYDGGGSYGGGLDFGFFKIAGIVLLLSVVLGLLFTGMDFLGFLGPWVQMQLPEGIDTKGISLYAVNRSSERSFQVRDEKFDQTGLCKLRAFKDFSDIYLEQDGSSVWLGTAHLLNLNTAVVEDVTYEEIVEQMVRPLILQLKDENGSLSSQLPLTIHDTAGNPLSYLAISPDSYAVLLPNDFPSQTLTLRLAGYVPCEIPVDATQRLSMMALSLVKETGGRK